MDFWRVKEQTWMQDALQKFIASLSLRLQLLTSFKAAKSQSGLTEQ